MAFVPARLLPPGTKIEVETPAGPVTVTMETWPAAWIEGGELVGPTPREFRMLTQFLAPGSPLRGNMLVNADTYRINSEPEESDYQVEVYPEVAWETVSVGIIQHVRIAATVHQSFAEDGPEVLAIPVRRPQPSTRSLRSWLRGT